MILLHHNGTIYHAVLDKDWFTFMHTTNLPLEEFVIDEVSPDNKNICIDLIATIRKTDQNGVSKYFIQNGQLCENVGWESYEA